MKSNSTPSSAALVVRRRVAARRTAMHGVCALALMSALAAPALAQTTERVSVGPGGAQSNALSVNPTMSADGRYVAFVSSATNLVPDDTNATSDIFVYDRLTGTTERANVNSAGVQANFLTDETQAPPISGDGRYVAFASYATNLVSGATNSLRDVFVRDRIGGTTERVSINSLGTQSNGDDINPAISGDGRYVAFESAATNLVSGDTNAKRDIFIRDRSSRATERVSISTSGEQTNADSQNPKTSADGRYVAFYSVATNVVSDDTNGVGDVFLRDRETGTTARVSLSYLGGEGNGQSYAQSMSRDGRFIAFQSFATNLVPGDTNGKQDIFVRDVLTGTTERVSVDSAGNQANDFSTIGSISADGRFVSFRSAASNLVEGDTNGAVDIFVHDRMTGGTRRVSIDSAGTQQNGAAAGNVAISANGSLVAFSSFATNLVAGDTNGVLDVFVHGPLSYYNFIGFNTPVDNLPVTNAAKAGSTIPVKWQLTDAEGNYVSDLSAVKSLQQAPVACDAQDVDLVDPIEAYAAGSSGLRYDPLTNEYVFAWKTAKAQKNTCTVFALTLADGQRQFARFWLK